MDGKFKWVINLLCFKIVHCDDKTQAKDGGRCICIKVVNVQRNSPPTMWWRDLSLKHCWNGLITILCKELSVENARVEVRWETKANWTKVERECTVYIKMRSIIRAAGSAWLLTLTSLYSDYNIELKCTTLLTDWALALKYSIFWLLH